jgi:glycosyltransferase involved in cell wall biosynthesis
LYIGGLMMQQSPPPLPDRVAIVHEWFTAMRGGEKCVEAMCEMFPQAELFTLVHKQGAVTGTIERHTIHTSFIQKLPQATRRYRYYLPLFPSAIQRLDLSGFELVITSHHCVAKGVKVDPGALHLCYCYTPMRYIWGLFDEYFAPGRAGFFTRAGMKLALGYLRRWDVATASNPHRFVAISENVRQRIRKIYQRQADVIYPPVDTAKFQVSARDDGYFLIVSALVPYKRIDLAIEAFNRSGERLVIVGDGPEESRLKKLARPNIGFAGWQPDDMLKEYYAGCRALVFPGEEDFGIVPLEAMASGKPVIAFARGGALETVFETEPVRTGVLFHEATAESLIEAVGRFKPESFDPHTLRGYARTFDREVFKRRLHEYILKTWSEFRRLNPVK